MNTFHVKQNLMKAFGVETPEDLSKHLTKTDLNSRQEMLYAAAVIHSYASFYRVKNRNCIREILESESIESQHKLAIDAKHGYGYSDQQVAQSQ
jgi:hypothetical protein